MAKTFEQLVPAPAGRFDGISRPYSPAEVEKLRGSVPIAYTLAEKGANRLWESLKKEPYVNSLGAVTGNQAMQQARAGLPAIYLSGWQVAADANTAGAMYPDQSLYPANAGPELCRRINRTFQRADQIEHSEGGAKIDWLVCAGCGGSRIRLRRPLEFVRDHEGLYRGGRGRRSLRGPARVGKEVRPHGRQGPDPDRGA
jgi:isocitrate lyase